MQSGGRGSSPAPRVRRLADEMVGVQVAKEFDGRVYIGEVIASVPPEEDEEPATLAATRAPVAARSGPSCASWRRNPAEIA